MTDTTEFAQTLQTFGSSPARWETDQAEQIKKWTETPDGTDVLNREKELDCLLDSIQPPVCTELIDRIQAAVMQDCVRRQVLLFWRISPWISFLCVLCGFYLGWYQSHQDYINMQSYFSSMFDDFNYEQYLQE